MRRSSGWSYRIRDVIARVAALRVPVCAVMVFGVVWETPAPSRSCAEQ